MRGIPKNEARLQALLDLAALKGVTEHELVSYALEEIVSLTDSEIGYLHFVNPDQQSVSLYAWSKAALANCEAEKDPDYALDAAGIWADCLRQSRLVIHNDYPNEASARGLPNGHAPVTRHMSVPIFDGETIVAIAGVGNKEGLYDESDAGQLTLFVGSLWQIIKRSRAEASLRESESQHRIIFENSPLGMAFVDHDGVVVKVNARLEEIFGVPRDGLVGVRLLDLPLIAPVRRELEEALGGTEGVYDGEYAPISGTRTCFVRMIFSPLETNAPQTGIIISVEDVTERRKDEEKIRQLSEATEQSPASVVITDREGIISYVNRRFTKMTGYSAEEAIGQKPSILKSGKHSPEFYSELWKTITAGKVWRGEFQNRKKNGDLYTERALIAPVRNDSGAIICFAAVKEDITERKDMERRLLDHERLKMFTDGLLNGQEDERKRIARELHDDFSQELAVLAIDLGILRRPEEERGQHSPLEGIQNRVIDLADKMRRLSHQLHPASLDLGLNEALKMHCQEFERLSSIRTQFKQKSLPAVLPQPVELCLYRVVQESLSNIARHSGAQSVEVVLSCDESIVQLRVQDDGKGFNPNAVEGKGLGLVSMRERVALLDGTIDVNSDIETGTCISVQVSVHGPSDREIH